MADPTEYLCGAGEDLSADGKIAGDDGDRIWEPVDSDPVTAGNQPEVWTETDALNPDTDGDSLCDGSGKNLDPNTPSPACAAKGGEDVNDNGVKNAGETSPLDADTDDDALGDLIELQKCTDGTLFDTDVDGLYDGWKEAPATQKTLDLGAWLTGSGTAPTPVAVNHGLDTWNGFDGVDGILGNADDEPGEDVNRNGAWNGSLTNAATGQETNACVADTDVDGVLDGVEYQYYESFFYNNPIPPNTNQWNSANDLRDDTDIDGDDFRPALDPDSDGDLLPDGWIDCANQPGTCTPNGVKDPGEYEDKDFNGMIAGDADGDRVIDAGEVWTESDPISKDTDR